MANVWSGNDARDFAPDSIINGRYVVQRRLGDGAFSTVYHVFDAKLKCGRALKVFHVDTTADDRIVEEYQVLETLHHPAIGRVIHLDQIQSTPMWFLILEYLDGQPLTDLIKSRKLSIQRSVSITRQILEGLAAVHARGLLHRDVKPSNIMVVADRAKLIDFNIARPANDPLMQQTGTPPFMAPDIYGQGWNASGDTYGLGLCLFLMLTGEYPFPNGRPDSTFPIPDLAALNPRVAPALAEVVIRSIQPREADRYPTAAAMLQALNVIAEPEVTPPTGDEVLDLAALGIDEAALNVPGQNPLLPKFLSLYSQSKDTNAGTRGLDAFTRLIYVPTRIDRELKPAIQRGEFQLVIITGNAGDGKTAFIQTLEDHARDLGAHLDVDASGNGTSFTLHGRRFVTNYDGSQDEGDTANDAVLAAFLAPFQGHDWAGIDGKETRIIAINEGRLVDFLQQHRRSYPGVRQHVAAFFEQRQEPPPGLMIVNLNLRAVTAGSEDDPSIFDRLLERFTAPVFWDRCQSCDAADRCYVAFNVRTMRDPIYGPQARSRLRRLFTAAHYRGQLHLTIRDLRSALAYTLFGVRNCDEIRSMLNDPAQTTAFLGYHYYNAPFADSAANTSAIPRVPPSAEPSGDRLITLLSQADVADVANPRIDAALNTASPMSQPLFAEFGGRSTYDRELLGTLRDAGPEQGAATVDTDALAAGRAFHAMARRKAYFERPDADTAEMLPFSTLAHFDDIVRGAPVPQEEVRNLIGRALAASEGVHHETLRRGYVCLRIGSERTPTMKSIRRFPIDQFRIEVPHYGDLARFIEILPSSFALTTGALRLDLNLDLFEMLSRIDQGFTPNREELKGPFVNLLIFKRQLHGQPYTEILLTPDERAFFRVAKRSDNTLELAPIALDPEVADATHAER